MNFTHFWELKVQILPILISLLIVEVPNIIRKLKKFYYIPIYFSIFPLRELNPNLAYYLGEDYFTGIGSSLNEEELERLKKKLVIDSIISIFIDAIVIPSLAGFVFAFFLDNELLLQAVIVILTYKLFKVIRAIFDFKDHAIGSKKNIILLLIIYVGYLGVFVQLIFNAYYWANPFINKSDYKGLLLSLSDLIFNKGIAQGLILAALAAFFANQLADMKIRKENVKSDEDTKKGS